MHQEFDPRDLEPSLPKKQERAARSKIAPIMIAVVALAGFGGVVWYAYDQGVRQTAGPTVTPLIKADTSPTKVRPDQPGGMDVPHQDKLVLNTLADGAKPGAAAVERLLPPPETPLPRPAATAPAAPPSPTTASSPTAVPLPPKIGPAPAQTATASAPPSSQAAAAPAPAAPAPAPVVAAAPPPTPAPAPAAPPPAAKSVPEKQVAAAPKPAPAAAVNGSSYRVQLVSVKAQTETNAEWARLQRSFPELAPLHMSVTRVDLGDKGVWYRIFGGPFSDAAAASRLCDALKAKNQGCVVAKH